MQYEYRNADDDVNMWPFVVTTMIYLLLSNYLEEYLSCTSSINSVVLSSRSIISIPYSYFFWGSRSCVCLYGVLRSSNYTSRSWQLEYGRKFEAHTVAMKDRQEHNSWQDWHRVSGIARRHSSRVVGVKKAVFRFSLDSGRNQHKQEERTPAWLISDVVWGAERTLDRTLEQDYHAVLPFFEHMLTQLKQSIPAVGLFRCVPVCVFGVVCLSKLFLQTLEVVLTK